MNLVLAARNRKGLTDLAGQVEALGSTARVIPTDVTQADQCRHLIAACVEKFGTIDYLILSAGISMWARFDEITETSIMKKLMETNYLGAVNCIHPALPYLKHSGGTIVAISSLQAVLGVPTHTGYSASKHALKGFLDALEMEIGDQVHILNAMPGWIRGTNLRTNALKGDGVTTGVAHKHDSHTVGVEECSSRILAAMQRRRREIYIPAKLGYLPWLRWIAPNLVRGMIIKAVNKQKK